ncbi:Vacuolar protein sorting-associated protein 1 [Astathelohania contejeani]|uniref:Vacuolar protein sorting-associated protein 1 n=1 Tax=Astathelohania contejeani TaxID=164912 RepID=A0ABQ7HXH5_9MICR|nr:Vacuolar protein sorting-associated protein 1 [Thelohania contejeani]
MDLLIEKINGLQDICTQNGINHTLDLPQIVVVGSQSSGKSSVLENIVGRDFLPRGCGIVTRRPLILQLIYTKEITEEYVIFNHSPEIKFTDFEKVKNEITAETNRLLKSKNDVSHLPITMKLFSSNVLTLTLIDLPGLVKVPTGDQPKNICLKIEEICKSYIINKNAIILAVSAANIDLSNSDALQLARLVDPAYDRTIGVLTKVDLMDKGTDVIDILAGRIIPLRLGYVPVVNRSQKDIEKNKNISQALLDEKSFFENHEAYKKNKNYCGTPYLVNKLNTILHEHIKMCLPELQERINILLHENENNLLQIGPVNLSAKETVLKIINDVTKNFGDSLKGNFETNGTEIVGGARLNYTFHSHFSRFISSMEALENIKDDQIRTLLYNASGSASVLLFTHGAFEQLVKMSILNLKPHALKLVSIVFNEMVKLAHQVVSNTISVRYPSLNEKLISSLINLFKKKTEDTHYLVSSIIEWNVNYINTRHPDFIKWSDVISNELKKLDTTDIKSQLNLNIKIQNKDNKITFDPPPNSLRINGSLTDQETIEIGIIKSLVISYFEIVKKIVIDQVPKAIMSELVQKSEQGIQSTLFREIYELPDIEKYVDEGNESKEQRIRLENNIKALKQAYDIMCSI